MFWKCLDQNPGPIFAAVVFLSILECETLQTTIPFDAHLITATDHLISSLSIQFLTTVFSGIAITEGRKSGDRAPGDFGFNPLNFGKTAASQKDLATKEIRNGRLAMWAAAGILLQESTTHVGALEAIL